MVDYSQWKIRTDIPVTEVKLDKMNPRMPEKAAALTQEDVVNLMVNDYRIEELAESIAAKGFMPLDLMVIVFEDNAPVVLEGNRRITALKLLINPALAPVKERGKYEAFNAQIDAELLMYPRFIVAPSREYASPLILDRHTISTEIPWTPIMQAEFHRNILQGRGLTIPTHEVLEEYNLKEKDIADSLTRLSLYERISSFSYPSTEMGNRVCNKLKFDITTLERIVNSSASQKRFRYSIENCKYSIENEKIFNAFLKSVVIHMYEPIGPLQRITSRTANTTKQIKNYLEAIESEIKEDFIKETEHASANEFHDTKNSANVDDKPLLLGLSAEEAGAKSQSSIYPEPFQETENRRRRRRFVHENELGFGYYSPANKHIYEELGRIPVKDAPFSVAIVIRIFMERSIRAYLRKLNKKKIPVIVDEKRRCKAIADATFGEILEWIIRDDSNIVLDFEVRKSLKKFKNGSREDLLSLSRLNAVIHEQLQMIDKEGVISIWDNLAPIFEYFMNSPETNSESMANPE